MAKKPMPKGMAAKVRKDEAADTKRGIKEGSKADKAADKKAGIPARFDKKR